MKLYTDIVTDYLEGKSLSTRATEWFFTQPGYCFEEPDSSTDKKNTVRQVYEQVLSSVKNFVPCNRDIWDVLFPDWGKILQKAAVALIVGYPAPNDAVVMKSPANEYTAILDMGLWTQYLGVVPLGRLVHNLLTHELCHVCIHEYIPELDEIQENGDYLSKLDAFTFDEGLAHFVSYNGQEASEVDWDSELLRSVWIRSAEDMRTAQNEHRDSQRREWLYRAIFGKYYDKFACMCGMLHFADCWRKGGLGRLKEEFAAGWPDFARKAMM